MPSSSPGTYLYRPSATDSGDTACQGAVNVDQIGLLATPGLLPVSRNWLTMAVVRQPGLHNAGQVWSQPGGPYHGFGQGANEANAELILMAAMYASHTGDRALFRTAPERLLCAESGDSKGQWGVVGTGNWTSVVCSTGPATLLDAHPQLYGDYGLPPHITVPRGKSTPGSYPGQGTLLVTRAKLPSAATALSLGLLIDEGTNFTVCVRDIARDTVVSTVSRNGVSGWFTVRPAAGGASFPAGVYDVAVQTYTGKVRWLSDSTPIWSGGARTEVYDEGDPPRGCCGKHAFGSTLAVKLERALAWQLNLSRKASSSNSSRNRDSNSSSSSSSNSNSSASASSYGMFVTADARFSGRPMRAKGITSSSAMWDQVRMGWKAGYPALRVLGSLVAWRELAAAGLVAPAGVSEELVQSVKDDIVVQLGQADGTLLSWRSCEVQEGVAMPPSGLRSSSCDRDDPRGGDQRSFDLGFVPDHALAVKLGVINRDVLLGMMPKIRHRSGHRLAIKRFEDQYMGGLIMVDSEKWNFVTERGFAEARPDQTGWSQVFDPSENRTDGPGNYNMAEQNGGRLFSVSKMILEATLYPEAAADWVEQVRGSTAIAATLLQGPKTPGGNCSSALPLPDLVRTPMERNSLAHKYCEVAYGCMREPSSCPTDCFGKTACDYYGDMTWGLRDGQLGPVLELLKGLLGLRLHPNGTMHLYHKAVDPSSCTRDKPCRVVQLSVPQKVAASWPADILQVELGGINVGAQQNCSIVATVNYTSAARVALTYTISGSEQDKTEPPSDALIRPGQDWLDETGRRVDAHSGRVFWDPPSARFFWHGMATIGGKHPAFHLVNCYSSADLSSWRFEGVALNTSHYVSRPKVLRHPSGRYLLWMKSTPQVAVAEASTPAGPFALLAEPFKLFGAAVGGANAYVDPASPTDAFFIYSQKPGPSNNQTRTMTVARMTSDWRNVSAITATYPGHLEGPAMFFNKTAGLYYLWTSHTSGWDGSPAVVHFSANLGGPTWTPLPYNPTHNKTSWQSQSSDILAFPTPEAPSPLFIYVADRFIPYINDGTSGGSRPVWLPFCGGPGAHNFSVPWVDAWSPAAPPC